MLLTIKPYLTELAWLQAGLIELAMKVSGGIDTCENVLKTKKPD